LANYQIRRVFWSAFTKCVQVRS